MRQTLKKREKLNKPGQYQNVYKRGVVYRTQGLALALLPNELNLNRVGISVGKKTARLSTERNRIKRALREAYRQNKDKVKPGFDLVLIGKRQDTKLGFQNVCSKLLALYKKAGILVNGDN